MSNPISSFHGAALQSFFHPYEYPIQANEEIRNPIIGRLDDVTLDLNEFFDWLKTDRIDDASEFLTSQFIKLAWQPFLDKLVELALQLGCKETFLRALSLSTGFADEISRSIVDAYTSNQEQELYQILNVIHGQFIKLDGLMILKKFIETPNIWNHLPLFLRDRMKRQPIDEVLSHLQSLTDREVRLKSISDGLSSASKSNLDQSIPCYLQDGEWLCRFEEIVCIAKNTSCEGVLLEYFKSREAQIYLGFCTLARNAHQPEYRKFASILMAQLERVHTAFETIGGHEFFIKFFKSPSVVDLLSREFINSFLGKYKTPSKQDPELLYVRLYLLIKGSRPEYCFKIISMALEKIVNSERWLDTLHGIVVFAKAKNRIAECRQLFSLANFYIQKRLYRELKEGVFADELAKTQHLCFEKRIKLLLDLDAIYTSIGMADHVSIIIKEKSYEELLPPVFHVSNAFVSGDDVLKSLQQVQKRIEEIGANLLQNAVVGNKEKFKVYSHKRVWKVEAIYLAQGISLFIKGDYVGEGTYKTVTRLIPLSDAKKVVEAKQKRNEPIYRQSFLKEYSVFSLFQQRNVQHVVNLFEMYIYRDRARLLMEELDGEITEIVKVLPDSRARLCICKQVVDAVSGIHALGYAHFDLKIANILYKRISPAQFDVRIADLGSVQKIDVNMELCSSYPAPEIMDRFCQKPGAVIKYNKEQDYWNIGDILYFLNYGISPFCTLRLSFNQNKTMYNEKLEILEREYLAPLRGSERPIDRSIAGLFSRDPRLRPNLQEVHDAIVKTME